MTELNISWNQFRVPGAKCLARGLKDNMKLKLVNASWNGIDDEGALAFSDCLSNNAVLTELDISCSRIGDKGYAQVMRAFKKNTYNGLVQDNGITPTAAFTVHFDVCQSRCS
eukprot:XP_011423354.1 PREDICTED: leucine-rich repeat-containing protein 74B [Crassostrea gigas]